MKNQHLHDVSLGDDDVSTLTLWSHCHLHSPQAAKCCRNSRLVVDEDDLMLVQLKKKYVGIFEIVP